MIQTHYNCNCVLVLTCLKMTICMAKMCWLLQYNWFGLLAHPLSHTCNNGHVNYSLQFMYYNTT